MRTICTPMTEQTSVQPAPASGSLNGADDETSALARTAKLAIQVSSALMRRRLIMVENSREARHGARAPD